MRCGSVACLTDVAEALASWATAFEPTADDLALADRSLRDTVAVMYAAREHPLRGLFDQLGEAGRLAALAHVLDFDDLHMASTTHVSAVCVAAALGKPGDGVPDRGDGGDGGSGAPGARAYLAGAGIMARLGTALGWRHYTAGWHATCTAGAPAAAVTAAVARGLDAERTAAAMALAIPGAGGVQAGFGTAAKALQVGFAVDAGVRAARLAEAGASADPGAVDQWLELVGGSRTGRTDEAEAVPGGLAIKLFPCCYALQRPIAALMQLRNLDPDHVEAVRVTTPTGSLKPLIHSRPTTGLQGKFSLEYGIAATLLDRRPDLNSFTDEAVQREQAQALMARVEVNATDGGDGLLDGEVQIEVALNTGETQTTSLQLPPGAPGRPPTDEEIHAKLEACAGPEAAPDIAALTWQTAPAFVSQI